MSYRIVDRIEDVGTFLELEARASAPYSAFVYDSEEESRAITKKLFEAGAAEFAPPFGRAVLDEHGALVAMFAGPLAASELSHTRLRAARALRSSITPAHIDRMRAAGETLMKLEPGDQYLSRIAVLPSRQRLGIARRALDAFLELAAARGGRRAVLEVAASATSAQGLYAAAGFITVADREVCDSATGRTLAYRHMAKTL